MNVPCTSNIVGPILDGDIVALGVFAYNAMWYLGAVNVGTNYNFPAMCPFINPATDPAIITINGFGGVFDSKPYYGTNINTFQMSFVGVNPLSLTSGVNTAVNSVSPMIRFQSQLPSYPPGGVTMYDLGASSQGQTEDYYFYPAQTGTPFILTPSNSVPVTSWFPEMINGKRVLGLSGVPYQFQFFPPGKQLATTFTLVNPQGFGSNSPDQPPGYQPLPNYPNTCFLEPFDIYLIPTQYYLAGGCTLASSIVSSNIATTISFCSLGLSHISKGCICTENETTPCYQEIDSSIQQACTQTPGFASGLGIPADGIGNVLNCRLIQSGLGLTENCLQGYTQLQDCQSNFLYEYCMNNVVCSGTCKSACPVAPDGTSMICQYGGNQSFSCVTPASVTARALSAESKPLSSNMIVLIIVVAILGLAVIAGMIFVIQAAFSKK